VLIQAEKGWFLAHQVNGAVATDAAAKTYHQSTVSEFPGGAVLIGTLDGLAAEDITRRKSPALRAIVQGLKAKPAVLQQPFEPFVAVEAQLRIIRKVGADFRKGSKVSIHHRRRSC
jgi:hypothetical protein